MTNELKADQLTLFIFGSTEQVKHVVYVAILMKKVGGKDVVI